MAGAVSVVFIHILPGTSGMSRSSPWKKYSDWLQYVAMEDCLRKQIKGEVGERT